MKTCAYPEFSIFFARSGLCAAARRMGGVSYRRVALMRDGSSEGSKLNKPASVGVEMALFVGWARSKRCNRGREHSVSAGRRAQNVLRGRAGAGHLLTRLQRLSGETPKNEKQAWRTGVTRR